MHQTRQEVSIKLPIPRKGTKYVASARDHNKTSVPVVIALRDMLKLARTAKEVNEMLKKNYLKINGRIVSDLKESIKLFNLLQADKTYVLKVSPTGKYIFEEVKDKDSRLCKVIGKKLLSKGKIQLNMHDGSNIISKDKISIGDSVYLDLSGKIKRHIPLSDGKEVLIFSGKYIGYSGKIESINGNIVSLKIKEKENPVLLDKERMVVL